jgi:O-antigen/teichoic acid export membrane protein
MHDDDATRAPGLPPGDPVSRFAWQSGGLVVGRGAAFVALVLIARDLGSSRYGEFVVLLALLELATVPWKPTVQQGAAARLGRGASQRSWRMTMLAWWCAGSIPAGGIAWVFAGPLAALALVMASLANAAMIDHVPQHILDGRQRSIAVALSTSQLTRLGLTIGFIAVGWLTPTWAIALHAFGYLAGALTLRDGGPGGDGSAGSLGAEVGSEALRWIELHGPILIVASVLGLATAGGFDLLYKLVIAIAEMLAGIGIVLLPAMVRAPSVAPVIARGVRVPTVGALVAGVGFALAASPLLSRLADLDVAGGFAPALLAVTMVVAPWMGVSKSALLTVGAARWLVPSQAATAVAVLVASALTGFGVVWAAFAVALAHLAGGAVRWIGLRSSESLPALRTVMAPGAVGEDLRWLWQSARSARS